MRSKVTSMRYEIQSIVIAVSSGSLCPQRHAMIRAAERSRVDGGIWFVILLDNDRSRTTRALAADGKCKFAVNCSCRGKDDDRYCARCGGAGVVAE